MPQENKLVVFEDKQIRRTWHNEEWYFSVTDVIASLTDALTTYPFTALDVSNNTNKPMLSAGSMLKIAFKIVSYVEEGTACVPFNKVRACAVEPFTRLIAVVPSIIPPGTVEFKIEPTDVNVLFKSHTS